MCWPTHLYCEGPETQDPADFMRLRSVTRSLVNCPKDDPSVEGNALSDALIPMWTHIHAKVLCEENEKTRNMF